MHGYQTTLLTTQRSREEIEKALQMSENGDVIFQTSQIQKKKTKDEFVILRKRKGGIPLSSQK